MSKSQDPYQYLRKTNNPLAEKLIAHLKFLKLNETQAADLLNLDEKNFVHEAYFNKHENRKEHENEVQYKKRLNECMILKKSFISKLYFRLGVNPEDYLPDVDPDNPNRLDFTRSEWIKFKEYQNRDSCIDIPFTITDPGTTLEDAYIHKLKPRILKAKKSITINEITFKGNNKYPGHEKQYETAQESLLNHIYNQADKISGKYIRYFHLSMDSLQWIDDNEKDSTTKFAFLSEVSTPTLVHVLKCLDSFPEKCEFLISEKSWFSSHCLIDDEILLTEEYLRKRDRVIPRLIFIDDLSMKYSKIKKLSKTIKAATEGEYFAKIKSAKDLFEIANEAIKEIKTKRNIIQHKIWQLKIIKKQCQTEQKMFLKNWMKEQRILFKKLNNQEGIMKTKKSLIKEYL